MHIKDVEALKSWISNYVAPITDAEPLTFSKYVVALLKKEKTEEELVAICLRDLEIFLKKHTTEFVTNLFSALQTDSYLQATTVPRSEPKAALQGKEMLLEKTIEAENPKMSEKPKILEKPEKTRYSEKPRLREDRKENVGEGDKYADHDLRDRLGRSDRRHKVDSVSKDEGRMQGKETSRKHLQEVRDKDYESRHKSDRHHRHDDRHRDDRDPYHAQHRYELKRSHRDKNRSKNRSDSKHRSKNRSPSEPRPKYRSPSELRSKNRSASGTNRDARTHIRSSSGNRSRMIGHMRSDFRSSSRERVKVAGKRSRSQSLTSFPRKDFTENMEYERSGSITSESGDDSNKYRYTIPIDKLQDVADLKFNKCPEFTDKGVCMRGHMCPYDHGKNPLIIKHFPDPNLHYPGNVPQPLLVGSDQLTSNSTNQVMAHQQPHLIMSNRPPLPPGMIQIPYPRMHFLPPIMASQPQNMQLPLPTSSAQISGGPVHPNLPGHPNLPLSMMQPPPLIRYAIMRQPVPMNQRLDPGFHQDRQVIDLKVPPPTLSVKERLGAKVGNQSTTIELRNVPTNLNNITSIDQQFNKFGSISNIQVCYNDDPGSAIITFKNEESVDLALTNSEPFFNNRFIQVLRCTTLKPPVILEEKKSVKDRLGSTDLAPPHLNPHPTTNIEKLNTDRKVIITKSNSYQNTGAMKKINKPKIDLNKEVVKRKLELNKQRQKLYLTNCEKIKIMLKKAENIAAPERNALILKIKELNKHNEKLRTEISEDAVTLQNIPKAFVQKSYFRKPGTLNFKQQLDRELLDAELDLMSGENSDELQKKVNLLRMQSSMLRHRTRHSPRSRGFRGRFHGQYRGRYARSQSRGNAMIHNAGQHLLDRRTKQVLVEGVTAVLRQEAVDYFEKFAKVETKSNDSLILTFPTRVDAEKALLKAHSIQNVPLQLSWFNQQQGTDNNKSFHTNLSSPDADYDVEEHAGDTMIELIIEDDDEDDDDDDDVAADEFDEYAHLGQTDQELNQDF